MIFRNLYCGSWDFKGEICGIGAFRNVGTEDQIGLEPVETTGGAYAGQCNITFLREDLLVSVTEVGKGGTVISYRIGKDGRLEELDAMRTRSGKLSYISSEPGGKYVFVSSMGDATVKMIRVEDDGKLVLTDEQYLTGHGFTPRQMEARIHSCKVSPDGKLLAAANLGGDETALFAIDTEAERLRFLMTAAVDGAKGPRHMAFSPAGEYLYVLTEMGARLYVYRIKENILKEIAVYPTMDPDGGKADQPADVIASRDGRYVYVTNRGQNNIAVFRTTGRNGYFDEVSYYPVGGDNPRSICFTPDNNETGIFCANCGTGTVTYLPRDPQTGALGKPQEILQRPKAACVRAR